MPVANSHDSRTNHDDDPFENSAVEDGYNLDDDEIDFDEVEEAKRLIVKPDIYDAVVTGADLRYGQESQEPYLAVSFKITSGEFEGTTVWRNLFFSEKSRPFTKPILATLLGGKVGRNSISGFGEAIIDRFCRIQTGTRTYQGEVYNEIKRVLPPNTEEAEAPRPKRPGMYNR